MRPGRALDLNSRPEDEGEEGRHHGKVHASPGSNGTAGCSRRAEAVEQENKDLGSLVPLHAPRCGAAPVVFFLPRDGVHGLRQGRLPPGRWGSSVDRHE